MKFLRPLSLVLLTLLVYIPCMTGEFLFDDQPLIPGNPRVTQPDGFFRSWIASDAPDYFPMTFTTLWLEWQLWGHRTFGYHLTNVLLHAASALLLWRILARLGVPAAWLAAATFAVHPVNVQSVAWNIERKNTLSMFFAMVSVLSYLEFDERSRWRWYAVSLLAFLLALLSKTSVVAIPVVLLGTAWWRRGGVRRRDLIRSAPFLAVALVLGLVTVWFQYHRAIGAEVVGHPSFLARLASAGWAAWFYLSKAVLPIDLCFVYPRWEIDPTSAVAYLPGILLILGLGAAWMGRHSWGRPILAGLGYFIVSLVPVLGFFDMYYMKYSFVADHWQYVAIPGVIALGVGAAASWLPRHIPSTLLRRAAATLFLGLLAFLSWTRASLFQSEEALWLDTLARNPNCWVAHNNLGILCGRQGRLDDALHHLRLATELRPDDPDILTNLGQSLAARQQLRDAVKCYRDALRIRADRASTHNNLGIALGLLGNREDAVGHLKDAARLDPTNPGILANLGRALIAKGNVDEAIATFRQAVEVDPRHLPAHRWLAAALLQQRQAEQAVQQLQQGLLAWAGRGWPRYPNPFTSGCQRRTESTLERSVLERVAEMASAPPEAIDAMADLAWVLAAIDDDRVRNGLAATELAEAAFRLSSRRHARALDALAAAWAETGDMTRAVQCGSEAIDLAQRSGEPKLAAAIRKRLDSYRSGSAWRQTIQTPGDFFRR